ncbi:MAG: N-acetyltransferase [Comamonadaceae bacterium]|nr:MAG: N-acetyltransferase [Comamonadaceae bacterium]
MPPTAMTTMHTLSPAPQVAPEAEPLLHTLALALQDDPFYRAVTVDHAPTPERRAQCLREYFRPALAEAAEVGRLDTIGTDAAALWITAHSPHRLADASARKLAVLRACLGPAGWRNYEAIVDSMEQQVPQTLPAGSWYLSILGVNPTVQGGGLGARVMAPALAAADAAQVHCYIETYNARSVPFYARQGFTEWHEGFEPVTQSVYWTMVRAPRRG